MSGKMNNISFDQSANLPDTRGTNLLKAYYGIAHNNPRSRYYYFFHLLDEDTEAQIFFQLLGFLGALGQFTVQDINQEALRSTLVEKKRREEKEAELEE